MSSRRSSGSPTRSMATTGRLTDPATLVLLRHGQSTWNPENLFTGCYDVRPPALKPGDEMHPARDARYAALPPELLPSSECLQDVVARMLPYWYDSVVPDLLTYRCVLISAHGNSLRALVKHLDGLSEQEVVDLDIPTGVPRVYNLRADFSVGSWRYLGDPAEIERRAAEVKSQAR